MADERLDEKDPQEKPAVDLDDQISENYVIEDTILKNRDLAQEREIEQLQLDAATAVRSEALGAAASEAAKTVLTETQQNLIDAADALAAEQKLRSITEQQETERAENAARDAEERERQIADAQRREAYRSALAAQFKHEHQTGSFFDKSGKTLVMREQPNRIVAPKNHTPEAAKAILQLAEAKGWQAITAKGTKEFRRDIWMEASLRGIAVRGYEPNEKDKEALARQMDRSAENRIEPDKTAPPQKEQKSDRHPNFEVAERVIDNILADVKDPNLRQQLRDKFAEQLTIKAQNNEVPKIKIFDEKANEQAQQVKKEIDKDKEEERARDR